MNEPWWMHWIVGAFCGVQGTLIVLSAMREIRWSSYAVLAPVLSLGGLMSIAAIVAFIRFVQMDRLK